MTTDTQTDITILGMGNMGQAIARASLSSHRRVTIWNRNASRSGISSLVSAGAHLAPTLSAAIRASPVLAPCLLSHAILHEMLENLHGTDADTNATPLSNLTILNVTNSTPREARDTETYMRALGARVYIDAALMASPLTIGTGEAFVLCSGENEEVFERDAKELVAAWGTPRWVGGDAGAAEMFDAALLAGMYGVFAGGFTALGMLRRAGRGGGGSGGGGKSLKENTRDLVEPFVSAMVPFLSHIAGKIEEGDLGDDGHQVGMLSEGFKSITRACEDEGIDVKPLEYFFETFHREVREGNGGMGPAFVAKRFLKDD